MTKSILLLAVLALTSVACGTAPEAETAGEQSSTLTISHMERAGSQAPSGTRAPTGTRAHVAATPLEIKAACHALALVSTDCDATESPESCGSRLAAFESACRADGMPDVSGLTGLSEDDAVTATAACRSEAVWPEQVAPGQWVGVCGTEDGLAQYALIN